jgi:hypothetical protein
MDLCQLASRRRLAALAAHLPLGSCQRFARPPLMDARVSLAAGASDCALYRAVDWGEGAQLLGAALERRRGGGQGQGQAPGAARRECLSAAAAEGFCGSAVLGEAFGSAAGRAARAAGCLEGAWAAGCGLLLDQVVRRGGGAGAARLAEALAALAEAGVMADFGLYDDRGRLLVGRWAGGRAAAPVPVGGPWPGLAWPGLAWPGAEARLPPAVAPLARRSGVELWSKEDAGSGLAYWTAHFIADGSGGRPAAGARRACAPLWSRAGVAARTRLLARGRPPPAGRPPPLLAGDSLWDSYVMMDPWAPAGRWLALSMKEATLQGLLGMGGGA